MKRIGAVIVIILNLLLQGGEMAPANAAYQKYIDNLPTSALITTDTLPIQTELEAKVQEMVNAGHMALTYYYAGLSNTLRVYYTTPNETIYSLSIAYPYLSAGLKTSVKTFLNNELNSYTPLISAYYPPYYGKITVWAGARREYFQVDPNQDINFYPTLTTVNPSVLYSIWAYSYYTNDWTYATTNYATLKSLYTTLKSGGAIKNYPALAGVIGFARIAKQVPGHMADYTDAVNYAESGFTAAANFNTFLSTASSTFPRTDGQPYNPPPLFLFNINPIAVHFNRDIGLFLKENAVSAVSSYSLTLATKLPLWWLTEVGMTIGENIYATPEYSWTNFMLHAYVLGDKTPQLKKYLDKPDRKGDLFYLQKLVATLEGMPTCLLKYKGDANCDDKFDQSDFAIWQQEFTQTVPTKNTDFNGDGKVDLVDFEIWRSNAL